MCTQFLFAYGFAKTLGLEFLSDEWIGERVFALPAYRRPDGTAATRCNEAKLLNEWRSDRNAKWDEEAGAYGQLKNFEFRGYAQTQECANYYTKRQAQEWLRFRPEIETACADAVIADSTGVAGRAADKIVCHRRVGDYIGYGYPAVSLESYYAAGKEFGLSDDPGLWTILSEEDPTPHQGFLPDDLSFLPDFYRMVVAPTLLRANSSFSWLAALLGNGLVLSPIIDGLEGGKEHLTRFVAGNHPRLAGFDFTTEMRVAP